MRLLVRIAESLSILIWSFSEMLPFLKQYDSLKMPFGVKFDRRVSAGIYQIFRFSFCSLPAKFSLKGFEFFSQSSTVEKKRNNIIQNLFRKIAHLQ